MTSTGEHYRHIVLFRLHDAISETEAERLIELLRSLGALPEVISWRIERSEDRRKGVVICENGLFATREAFAAFQATQEHRSVAAMMSASADWCVADYPEQPEIGERREPRR